MRSAPKEEVLSVLEVPCRRRLSEPRHRRTLMSPDAINSVPAGASSAPQEPIRHLLNAEQRAKCRILLAEDNPVNQNLASRLLRKAGFQCDIANNGDEALKALTQEKYDLVLMDCHMPVMDGYAAAARIRRGEKSEASHLKIIAMTAEGAHGERQRCLAAGMDDHISKPFEMRALYEVIEKHLAGKNIFPPSEVPVPRSPSGPAASFNLTRLNEMTEGDREFERELLQQYAADTARHLTTISLEIERNN
ncbi:response regulator, partial [Candidatus Sumerlaeota bacterium]|nr:response regulator [Candidatus Sumerlaeota bacterium]